MAQCSQSDGAVMNRHHGEVCLLQERCRQDVYSVVDWIQKLLTKRALPNGCLMMRDIRQMCSAAYRNSTKSMRVLFCWLYSAR